MKNKLELILSKIQAKESRDRFDEDYKGRIEEILSKMMEVMPAHIAEKYLEVINTSADSKSSVVGTYILAEQIPKQIGMLEYDPNKACEPPKVKKKDIDYYFEVALKAAKKMPSYDYDILKNLPGIIQLQGPKTRKIIKTALMIRDGDFVDEHNLVLLYTGMKAGHTFGGDQEEHEIMISKIEHKYMGKAPTIKRVFTEESVREFLSGVDSMRDPRKRRGFLNSFYSELDTGRLYDLNGESLEEVISSLKRYGFKDHGTKISRSMHYRRVKKYDETIEKYPVSKDGPVSAVYQTKHTRKLDALFELKGLPLNDDEVERIVSLSNWLGNMELETIMPKIAKIAGKIGHFVGLPYDDAKNYFGVDERDLNRCIKEGYLETFEHAGILVISPTDKYQPADISWLSKVVPVKSISQ